MENFHLKSDKEFAQEVLDAMESTGGVMVTGIETTKNPNINIMYLAQTRDDVNTTSTSKENSFFLGWGTGSRIVRTIRSYDPNKFEAKVGMLLPEEFNANIQVQDSDKGAFYDGQEPRKRPNNGSVITRNGKPIFRNTSLVFGNPVHSIISDYDREVNQLPRVKLNEVMQESTVHTIV